MKKNNIRKMIANIIYVAALVMIFAGLYLINDNSTLGTVLMCTPCPLVLVSNYIKRSANEN